MKSNLTRHDLQENTKINSFSIAGYPTTVVHEADNKNNLAYGSDHKSSQNLANSMNPQNWNYTN